VYEPHEIVVVGAGPAGLAVASELRRRGLEPVVLEAGAAPGEGWRRRYDRLHLHTPRGFSGLPGWRIPRRYGRWLARDDVVRYLAEYAQRRGLDVRTGVHVERVDRRDGGWELATGNGAVSAQQVVLATGYSATPRVPDWPGRDSFRGELLHSAEYRSAEPFRGRDVLVVGTGNSGAEIAQDLAENGAARVRIAVRTPPHIAKRSSFGIPAQAVGIALGHLPPRLAGRITARLRRLTIPDLSSHGLPPPPETLGAQFVRTGTVPILDVGFVEQVRRGRIEVVAAVEALDGDDVVLADGTRIQPEAVLAATGFRPGIEPLVGHLGVLDGDGLPRSDNPEPGLWLFGYAVTLSGGIRLLAKAAPSLAARIASELASDRDGPIRTAGLSLPKRAL
jgi:putative flavoprotein involved in K+ transport